MSAASLARSYLLLQAKSLASNGDAHGVTKLCGSYLEANPNDFEAWGEIGNLFLNTGLLSNAEFCFQHLLKHDALDLLGLSGMASVELNRGHCLSARMLYDQLESMYPDNRVIRRNALMQMEYDPQCPNSYRFKRAMAWGKWVSNDPIPPRPVRSLRKGPVRVGYVSPDFCQHTVGLMLRDVISKHNRSAFEVFTYHVGHRKDWVTQIFEQKTNFRDAYALNELELHDLIVKDGIDLLVDLSGHSAGSRLEVFARRPAPVQLSWLGYFATTGLQVMDAILLDSPSVQPDTQSYFCERIKILKSRFCYSPLPFAPDAGEFPFKKNGFISFGSFNNTAKLNPQVIHLWAKILCSNTDSKLVLKWRTLLDESLRNDLTAAFSALGVAPERLDLRGPSSHINLLAEYNDIDIALDPFPFNGAQTSCDALLMGVPVITLAQNRPVSRQGASLLANTGLEDLIAHTPQAYIDKVPMLLNLIRDGKITRQSIRLQFLSSAICDTEAFVLDLERNLLEIYQETIASTHAIC